LKRMEEAILALHVRVDQIHAKVGASGVPTPPPPN
jgi:hypothetical protein